MSGGFLFISYASIDVTFVERLVKALEKRRIGCWYAKRNIDVGEKYPVEIIKAIDAARAAVVVLSKAAFGSEHVFREVEALATQGKKIIAIKTDDSEPSDGFRYFVKTMQWLDLREYEAGLADAIAAAFMDAPLPVPPSPLMRLVGRGRRNIGWIASVGLLAVALAAGSSWYVVGSIVAGPRFSPSQLEPALHSALAKGDEVGVVRLLEQKAEVTPRLGAALLAELAGDRPALRRAMNLVGLAAGEKKEEVFSRIREIAESDLMLVRALADRTDDVPDGDAIDRLCDVMGTDKPLARVLSDTASNPKDCRDGFRDQTFLKSFAMGAQALYSATGEIGGPSSFVSWLAIITAPYTNTTIPQDKNKEYRTFVDWGELSGNGDVLWSAPPITSAKKAEIGFLQDPRDAIRYVVAGRIVIVEGLVRGTDYMGSLAYFQPVGAALSGSNYALGGTVVGQNIQTFRGMDGELGRFDFGKVERDFADCWKQPFVPPQGKPLKVCKARLAVTAIQPRMTAWLGLIDYTILPK